MGHIVITKQTFREAYDNLRDYTVHLAEKPMHVAMAATAAIFSTDTAAELTHLHPFLDDPLVEQFAISAKAWSELRRLLLRANEPRGEAPLADTSKAKPRNNKPSSDTGHIKFK